MRVARRFAVVAILPGLAACMGEVDDRTIVDELRILALKAEPPEAAPGSAVSLEALVADPTGGGRPLALTWGVCSPDPVDGVASCATPDGIVPFGEGTSASLTIPEETLDGLDPMEAARGLDVYVTLHALAPETSDAPAASITAYKRVRVSQSSEPNGNPVLVALLADGRETLVADGESRELQALLSDGSLETYLDVLGEPRVEEIKYSWFSTGGTWASPRTFGVPGTGLGSNDWTAPAGDAADVWVLARDPRGGVDWLHRRAEPASGSKSILSID